MLMSGGAGSKDQRSRAYRSDVLVLIGMYVRFNQTAGLVLDCVASF